MLFSQATLAVLGATVISAAPTEKRANLADADILQYALTLEHLEDTFYRQGLAKYSAADFARAGLDAGVYDNFKTISSDEATHVDFLSKALKAAGVTPTAACAYSFPYTDVSTFVATASILEGVGVSAYLGAAAAIMSRTYLTAAGSILTVEARHSAYVRSAKHQKPFAQPFDAPLSPNEVYSLASAFISACPETNPKLPVRAFPALSVDGGRSEGIRPGDEIVLSTKSHVPQNTTLYAAFISVTGPVFVDAKAAGAGCYRVVVPREGFGGQTYAVLTSSKEAVNDDVTVAGPAIIEVSNGGY